MEYQCSTIKLIEEDRHQLLPGAGQATVEAQVHPLRYPYNPATVADRLSSLPVSRLLVVHLPTATCMFAACSCIKMFPLIRNYYL